jgi:hypothetical protein
MGALDDMALFAAVARHGGIRMEDDDIARSHE